MVNVNRSIFLKLSGYYYIVHSGGRKLYTDSFIVFKLNIVIKQLTFEAYYRNNRSHFCVALFSSYSL